MMLILALITTQGWATITGSGESEPQSTLTQEEIGGFIFYKDDSGNFRINNAEDWSHLADIVAAGHTCKDTTFLMTANIGTAEEPIAKTIGRQTGSSKNDRKRFVGTFDGGNHTLTIALNTNDSWWQYNQAYCAPFAYTRDATVKNLHVAGTVTTTNQFASGLVGSTGDAGVGTCTIDNCHVSVAITSNYTSANNKYANHGGFIGIAEGNASVTNSWFDGKFLGSDFKYSSGFMGMNKGANTMVTNCLFNPSEIQEGMITTGSCELVHSLNGGNHTITDTYWVMQFGELGNTQGQKVLANKPDQTVYTYSTVTAVDNNTYYIITGNLSWSTIQEALNADGTVYDLPISITAGSSDHALEVPTGASVTLNLGDYTIDRGLGSEDDAQANGYVIKVHSGASLTINGGTITGGHNSSNGGGIYNEGTLIINGTAITGNTSNGHGAGIYNTGDLSLNGATITGNAGKQHTDRGLGVYVANGTFSIQGDVQIRDNYYTYYSPTQSQVAHNIYLASNTLINIADELADGTTISVDGEGAIPSRVITANLHGNGTLKAHFAIDDNKNFALYETSNGEVKLNAALNIEVKGFGTGNDNWAFIASPVANDIRPYAVSNLLGSQIQNSELYNYDLYRFNQAGDGEWENYLKHNEDNSFKLVNGQGYLYARKNDVTLKFLGNYYDKSTKTVGLDYEEGKQFAGWNLVGNPFPVKAYMNRAYYKMNAEGTGVTVESKTTAIPACTGIMVKADGENETVTFSTTAPTETTHNQGNLQIALSQANTRSNAILDNAIVSFNDSKLGKFYFGTQNANIYIPQNGEEYAIASGEKQGEMPLNFKAAVEGEYTLTVNPEAVEMNYLHLIDNITGADIDLLSTPSYTFTAKPIQYASRFRLVFSAQSNNEENNQEDFAFVSNGQIIVNGNGMLQVFDLTGRVVFSQSVNSSLLTPNSSLTPGVYFLRMIDGEKVRTQKIFVK